MVIARVYGSVIICGRHYMGYGEVRAKEIRLSRAHTHSHTAATWCDVTQ